MSIIASLLKNVEDEEQEKRVLYKFVENGHEKLHRLLILRAQYEYLFTVEESYLERLERGLFTLQMIDLILVCLMAKSKMVYIG